MWQSQQHCLDKPKWNETLIIITSNTIVKATF